MKKSSILLAAGLLAVIAIGAALAAVTTSANNSLSSLWLGGGGGSPTSATYKLTGSAGQPAAASGLSSAHYASVAGFIPTTLNRSSATVTDTNPNELAVTTVTTPAGTQIVVTIPAGTFDTALAVTATPLETLTPTNELVSAGGGSFTPLSLPFGVTLTAPSSTEFKKPVSIAIHYTDDSFAAPQMAGGSSMHISAAATEKRLRIVYLTPQGKWLALKTTIDADANVANAEGLKFTTYQLVAMAAASTIDEPMVFPNPLRPALGIPYQKMWFANLPEGTKVMIFTLQGQLVVELTMDEVGQFNWDGTNGNGEKVASGVYFAHISHNSSHKTIKIAVER